MIPKEDYNNLSDTELIDLLRGSDHAAFMEIYQRYAYPMFVHAFKKLQDEDQAKDAIQELFTSLWYKRDAYKIDGSTLGSYLYVAMKNRIFDLFARQKVESRYMQSLNAYIAIGNSASTDHLIREKELQGYIDKEIQALTPKMRVIFQLSRKEQLTNSEIAEILNTSENNVSKQVSNAVRILRAKLSIIISVLLLVKL